MLSRYEAIFRGFPMKITVQVTRDSDDEMTTYIHAFHDIDNEPPLPFITEWYVEEETQRFFLYKIYLPKETSATDKDLLIHELKEFLTQWFVENQEVLELELVRLRILFFKTLREEAENEIADCTQQIISIALAIAESERRKEEYEDKENELQTQFHKITKSWFG